MIKNFRHACLIIKDLNKSLKFYRDLLGLRVSKIVTVKGKYPQEVLGIKGIKLTYLKMRTPNQVSKEEPIFELHCWKKPKLSSPKGYHHVSFSVQDLDKEYQRLKKLGVKFISSPKKSPNEKTKICFAYDPDKNLIELVEDLKK